MTSDPHESAAWRTFGMLDADEAAGFDEAMRHDPELKKAYREMDRLAAAVAVSAAFPIAPQAGQLERLHLRLGLNAVKRANWLGITGWAAAAVLMMFLIIDRNLEQKTRTVVRGTAHPATGSESVMRPTPVRTMEVESKGELLRTVDGIGENRLTVPQQETPATVISKVETRRLIQEIEVLREQLESVLERDRKRFESVPGMAWPIVVRMRPPEPTVDTAVALAMKLDDPPITTILGDALSAANQPLPQLDTLAVRAFAPPPQEVEPSAIPIYDSARDAGTLVVNNLPPTAPDEAFNLWVTTKTGEKPVYVGRLPESNVRGGESFDFSLGSKATVPSGFILTKDRQGIPPPPSRGSTILQGPR